MKKLLLTLMLCVSLFTFCEAQYTELFNFNGVTGARPEGSLTLLGSKLYGMTDDGGIYGSGNIFCIDTNGSGYKDLFDFDWTSNGALPNKDLTYAWGLLYGMTSTGGALGEGCMFYIDTLGNNYNDLHDFYKGNGATPTGDVTFSSSLGKFYGMTEGGGRLGFGTIFSINNDGSGWKMLFDLNTSIGENPYGSLLLSGGTLYGMGAAGGRYGNGTIFSIDTNGSRATKLHDFMGPEDAGPYSSLILSGNKLYGTTIGEYVQNNGSVFSINTNGSDYKILHVFNDTDGSNPAGDLRLSGSMLYGTTANGGANNQGSIFGIDTNGNGFKDLYDFDGINGAGPQCTLILAGNTFYGMTLEGGGSGNCNHGCGVIFRFKDQSLGINKIAVNHGSINVYPNPSSGVFTLQMNPDSYRDEDGRMNNIQVYNVLGENVLTETLLPQIPKGALNTIDLSSQPNGIYLYRVIGESGGLVGEGKMVIEK